jgi:hypothetical protein
VSLTVARATSLSISVSLSRDAITGSDTSPTDLSGGLQCFLLLVEKYQLRTRPYQFSTGLRISCEGAHLNSVLLLALKATNESRFLPTSSDNADMYGLGDWLRFQRSET